jgi:hypothetical protein
MNMGGYDSIREKCERGLGRGREGGWGAKGPKLGNNNILL